MEGYEGVAALVRGWPPQTPPVRQGHTPETRIGCAGGGWGVGGGGGGGYVLQTSFIQSLENVVYERLLLGNFRFYASNYRSVQYETYVVWPVISFKVGQ